jgi:hypothetical protein
MSYRTVRAYLLLTVVLAGFLLASLGPRHTPGTAAAAATLGPAQGPFVYPVDGQSIDFEGAYMFKAAPISGATGYLIGLFQNGVLQVENYRDYGTLNQEFAIWPGDPMRSRLLPNISTTVTVRGLINGQWTDLRQITIYLVPRNPASTATPVPPVPCGQGVPVALNPSSGSAGTIVTATGCGWAPGAQISVSWDNQQSLNPTRVDQSGGFTVSFPVPANVPMGPHQVFFSQSCVGCLSRFQTATFTVTTPT